MRKVGAVAVAFTAGMVVAINLGMLVETNPEYVGAWWKVVAGVILAVILPASLLID